MTVNTNDDERFANAISSYRECFLVQHSHLPVSKRNQLWIEWLSQFIPASNDWNPNWQPAGNPGKRTRQDATPRTMPYSDLGLPRAKRRATVRVTLVTLLPPFLFRALCAPVS